MKKLLKPFASLYLTVPLLALSILLVFAGTLAQRIMGVDEVVAKYFRSWLAWIDPRIFLPGTPAGHGAGALVPFPGGKMLIILLLVNLLAAHSVRFKLNWKRSGILLIHFSLILLLVGEMITGYWSAESQVQLSDGQTTNYVYDIRTPELAVLDQSPADHDNVTVVPGKMLKTGAVIDSDKLPFEVRIDDYYRNSQILGPMQAGQAHVAKRATAGEDSNLALVEQPTNPGTSGDQVDMPAAYVSLHRGQQNLGTFLLSTELLTPQHVQVDGKTYAIALRFKRTYKPYTLTLVHFEHDRYLGTDEAKNFASRVRILDPAHHVDREVVIWMNHPLRYAGDTIYQQGFSRDDKFTTLQVVWSRSDPMHWFARVLGSMGIPVPANPLPYIACLLGAIGLLIHFGMHLTGFLRRNAASRAKLAEPVVVRGGKSSYSLAPTTPPLWQRPAVWASLGALALAMMYVAGMALAPVTHQPEPYHLDAFGRLPVVSEGRVLPFDSLARNTLRIVHGRETLQRDGQTVSAIQWLIEGFNGADKWRTDKLIRIDHPDIISLLKLDPKGKYFSLEDLSPHIQELERQAQMANEVESSKRDSFQSKVLQLAESLKLMNKVFGSFRDWQMFVVPPIQPGEHWRTLAQVVDDVKKTGQSPEAAVLFTQTIEDYAKEQPGSFNADVLHYDQYLQQHVPAMVTKTHFEAYFNQFDPFTICLTLYAIVLILGFTSWLVWQKPLWSAAVTLLAFTLVIHTFGLAARVWLQGRPPVTNLYSSSIFIGWGVALLCVLLELIYRNGIASVTAAAMGFVTLIIAVHLSGDATLQPNGDTMAVLRAVLDTNLWLATHVVCITLGYASTFLAGFLGIMFVVRGLFTRSLDPELRKSLARMIYGIVCFAMFFSFVGTILGGIWADQSWGRFWGWDPKENGAILIVLWNALILHARWAGMVRDRGMALLAIFGNVVTSWSWFGTNMLGIGLHSYGFMDAAVPWLLGFDFSQLALIVVGLLPLDMWRSFSVPQEPAELVGAK